MPKQNWSKLPVTLQVGMNFYSPWLGNGTIVSFYTDSYLGDMTEVLWHTMNIVQKHTVSSIEHEVRLGLKK